MRLSRRERIYLIILAVVLTILGIHRFAVVPLLTSSREMNDEIATNRLKLRNYIQTLKRKQKYEVQMADCDRALKQVEKQLLTGPKLSIARSELQIILTDIARKYEVTIKKQDSKTESSKEMFMEVPVEVTITGELEKLGDFVYEIYTSEKALTIKEFEISKRTRRQTEEMEAKLVIAGFMFLQEEEEDKNV